MEDMGFVRMALSKAIAYSTALGVDQALRPLWAEALGRMAPFRTTTVEGLTVFAQSASFTTDWNHTNQTAGSVPPFRSLPPAATVGTHSTESARTG